jgi:hypothetical protein
MGRTQLSQCLVRVLVQGMLDCTNMLVFPYIDRPLSVSGPLVPGSQQGMLQHRQIIACTDVFIEQAIYYPTFARKLRVSIFEKWL